jgi:hypothetical protein
MRDGPTRSRGPEVWWQRVVHCKMLPSYWSVFKLVDTNIDSPVELEAVWQCDRDSMAIHIARVMLLRDVMDLVAWKVLEDLPS